MIAITRKRLLQAAQELMNDKKVPATVDKRFVAVPNRSLRPTSRSSKFVTGVRMLADWTVR